MLHKDSDEARRQLERSGGVGVGEFDLELYKYCKKLEFDFNFEFDFFSPLCFTEIIDYSLISNSSHIIYAKYYFGS